MYKVSVVMPVFNGMPYLPEALGSILDQTLKEIEVIVLDDASTDGSSEYLDSVRDDRLRVIHSPKQRGLCSSQKGISALLNLGIREARSPYVARMDCDDISLPERLEAQARFLDEHPDVVVCGCQAVTIDKVGKPIDTWEFPTSDTWLKCRLPFSVPFAHPTTMLRKSEVLAVGGYDANLERAEDLDLWWKLALRGKLANLSIQGLMYRVHGNNWSFVEKEQFNRTADAISTGYMERLGVLGRGQAMESLRVTHQRLFSRSSALPTYQEVKDYVEVGNKLFDVVRQRLLGRLDIIDDIRRENRWRILERMSACSRFSGERLRWLRLAKAVDPVEMSLNRLVTRVARRAFSIPSST
jgi:glycosyltransferase involved in cell wall biosynthesis